LPYTDTERLDFLQKLTEQKRYTGKVCLRWSSFRRGWRLYETSREGAETDVRDVIDKAMDDGMNS
jgi:hypothetical protein